MPPENYFLLLSPGWALMAAYAHGRNDETTIERDTIVALVTTDAKHFEPVVFRDSSFELLSELERKNPDEVFQIVEPGKPLDDDERADLAELALMRFKALQKKRHQDDASCAIDAPPDSEPEQEPGPAFDPNRKPPF